VTLRLKWFHQAQLPGFYVGEGKDLYNRSGRPEMSTSQPGGPDFPAIQMVTGVQLTVSASPAPTDPVAPAGRSRGGACVHLPPQPLRAVFTWQSGSRRRPTMSKEYRVKIGGMKILSTARSSPRPGSPGQADRDSPSNSDITPLPRRRRRVWRVISLTMFLRPRRKVLTSRRVSRRTMASISMPTPCSLTENMLKGEHGLVPQIVTATPEGALAAPLPAPNRRRRSPSNTAPKLTYDL